MDRSRSELMSRIGGSDTDPELRLRRALWGEGFRYRVNALTPAGRADVLFPREKVAIYVDGCFWHGCPEHYVRPRSRSEFWAEKLSTNVLRDRSQTLNLEKLGWVVCRFWEHEIYENLPGVVDCVGNAVAGVDTVHPPRWNLVEVIPLDRSGNRERRVMEALRDPRLRKAVDQARTTRKWKRPT